MVDQLCYPSWPAVGVYRGTPPCCCAPRWVSSCMSENPHPLVTDPGTRIVFYKMIVWVEDTEGLMMLDTCNIFLFSATIYSQLSVPKHAKTILFWKISAKIHYYITKKTWINLQMICIYLGQSTRSTLYFYFLQQIRWEEKILWRKILSTWYLSFCRSNVSGFCQWSEIDPTVEVLVRKNTHKLWISNSLSEYINGQWQ